MAREKKITIKPFLNKTLKTVSFEDAGVKYYPIYFLVTYDRRVTKIPALDNRHYPENKEDLLVSESSVLDHVERIEKIVRYEIDQVVDYKVTGLGKRMKVYFSRLSSAVEYTVGAYLRGKGFEVQDMVPRTPYPERLAAGIVTKASDHKISSELYYLARFIEINFPILNVYDWLLTEQRESVVRKLRAAYFANDQFDFEYANRLPGSPPVGWDVAEIVKALDNIANFSVSHELTLFSDLQIVTLERAANSGLHLRSK